MDIELIKIVKADIDWLSDKWNQDIDDDSLRITSIVLRKLLVDGMLNSVANYLNEKIYIMTPNNPKYEDQLDKSSIVFYQAGGAIFKGMEILCFKIDLCPMTQEEIKAESEMKYRSYFIKLSKFMNQTSFKINNVKINREEVIKYIVNKKGGAYFDPSRKDDILEKKYSLLDSLDSPDLKFCVADKNSVYYELLSIGQRLCKSDDVIRIRQILNNINKK